MNDLIAFETKDLRAELDRRRVCMDKGICSFCGRSYDEPPCARPDRHEKAGKLFHRGWKMETSANWIYAHRGRRSFTINRYNGRTSLCERNVQIDQFEVEVAHDHFMFKSAVDHAEDQSRKK